MQIVIYDRPFFYHLTKSSTIDTEINWLQGAPFKIKKKLDMRGKSQRIACLAP